MQIKLVLLSVIFLTLTACTGSVTKTPVNECDMSYSYNQGVFNNLAYRSEINKAFHECMVNGQDYNVNFEDLNKICRKSSVELYSGLAVDNFRGPTANGISETEARLRKCGYFK